MGFSCERLSVPKPDDWATAVMAAVKHGTLWLHECIVHVCGTQRMWGQHRGCKGSADGRWQLLDTHVPITITPGWQPAVAWPVMLPLE